MRRLFSIYHFLVALMIVMLISPAFAGAEWDQRDTGTLTIHKLALEPGVEPGERGDGSELNPPPLGEPVAGVTYKLKQTHTFDGEHWTELEDGPEFEMTTGEDGTATKTLPLGRYEVTEIAGPDHVRINNETFKVDIPKTSKDGASLNYDVHVYPKNEIIRGGAELIKYADETNDTLDGVKIQVFHANGDPVTDEHGDEIVLITENGKVRVDGLRYGDYYFQELETIDGYLLNQEMIPFSITGDNEVVQVALQNYSVPEVDKEVDRDQVNRGEVVEFTITVDLPKDIAKYQKFDVIDQLHEHLIYVDGSANAPTGFTFSYDDTTNTLTWTGDPEKLSPGEVAFTFKAKVSEDAIANEPILNEAEINYDNGYETRTDQSPPTTVTPTAGSLTVIKKDGSNDKRLAGAEFLVLDANGNEVARGTSGEDGFVDFNGGTDELDYGKYTIIETKAPEGYRAITKPIEVEINGDNHQAEVTVNNYKSDWELPKTGGIGTLLYSMIGLTLMGTAGYMYTRRKKGEQV